MESGQNYNYLLGMKLWSLTHEKVEQLRDQKAKKQRELESMENTTGKDLWRADLDQFEEAYNQYVSFGY